MGIQSMTGFGKAQFQSEEHNLLVEIKSVNNRFIDTRFRIPPELNQIEIKLKKSIGNFFKRGSFDVFIQCKALQCRNLERLDKVKIKSFINEFNEIARDLNFKYDISAGDFLKSEFFQPSELEVSEKNRMLSLVEDIFEKALKSLYDSRLSEGLKLSGIISENLKKLKDLFLQIEPLEGNYKELVESKLMARLKSYKTELKIDENRFHQEVIYYLERLDIKEEINRIKVHISEFEKILDFSGEVGRKLDFLIQELNRETNTLGAKSGLNEISDIVMGMKIELEKIREQVANLE